MISWYITFSFRFYYYTYYYSFVKYFNESSKECLKAARSNDTIAVFLRTNLIHVIYILYIHTHYIYIYTLTHTYSIVLNFSSFFAVARLFVYARDSTHGISSFYIDTCRSRRKITRKQRTYETLDNETRCKAGRTLARVCVNRRRRRTDWWSMRHKPEGAVLASAVKRGVRPRSSWLQESAWGDSSSSSGVANTGRQEPPNASGVFWAGWPFHSCRRTRRSLTGPKMLYIFHVDTGTTITFDIKLALQTWVSLH